VSFLCIEIVIFCSILLLWKGQDSFNCN